MAGTMVHLLVAEGLYEKLNTAEWKYYFDDALRFSEDDFIAGNICPDGIMARKGYQREMKLHTHFRDDIPDGSFEEEGNVEKFEARLKNFWLSHEKEEKERPGLYLGYVTHMMTDEKFILEERPRFFEEIRKIGLTVRDQETYVYFGKETDLADFWLIRKYKELQKAKESLERVSPYEIKGMITMEELTGSRNWILQHFFYEEHQEIQTEFLKCDRMERFASCAVEEIFGRLFAEGYLCKVRGESGSRGFF